MNVDYSYCFSRADQRVYFRENETAGPYGQDFNEFLMRCLKGPGGDKRMVGVSFRISELRRPCSLAHTHTESDNDNSVFSLATIDFFLISTSCASSLAFLHCVRTCFS